MASLTRIEIIINMIQFLTSTKTAPVLVESLADKKVKIGELVELSVAGSHSSNIWQDHQYHLRQNVVVPFVAKVNDKMIKSESISEMISVLLTIVTWGVIRSRWLDSLPPICFWGTGVIIKYLSSWLLIMLITSVPGVSSRASSLVEPWSSNCRGRQIFPCRGSRGQVGLVLWLSWGWNSWVVWPGWMDRADTFYTVWDQKVAEKGRKWHLLQEAFLTDYFGTFVQVDPPQEQKFLDEMSLSLSEEIHKTHKFRKK